MVLIGVAGAVSSSPPVHGVLALAGAAAMLAALVVFGLEIRY